MFREPIITIFKDVKENMSKINEWIGSISRETETKKNHMESLEMKIQYPK